MIISRRKNSFGKKPYMTRPEQVIFEEMQTSGEMSIFKISPCRGVNCEQYVPKGLKAYCSEECYRKEVKDEKKEETGSMD